MFGPIGLPELLIIAFIILLLFGGKKLPELFKSLGQAIREFNKAKEGADEKTEVGAEKIKKAK
jgi:sec-independent protein translocase protein TatA